MSNLLTPSPVSTLCFNWHRDEGMFSAEASDLGRGFRLGRVYNDACDVGFTLVSHRTGRKVVVALDREVRDAEGELLYTDFLAVPDGKPGHVAYRVRLWND